MSDLRSPNILLPAGTQIVVRGDRSMHGRVVTAGSVGTVIEAPADATHAYRIRFPDGSEVMLSRSEMSIRKHAQAVPSVDVEGMFEGSNLETYIIYSCIVGSQAFGLAQAGSDVDRRGIYLPPARLHWSLFGIPEQIENREREEVFWELEKFMVLALKANPNILECLYTPLVEIVRPPADQLLLMRDIFLSRLVYQTYNGYVLSQFKRLERGLRATGEIRWKHAMHLIRLLLSGIAILQHGLVHVDVGPERERLLLIREGETSWDEVEVWRRKLHATFESAFTESRLPERPDYARANAFLITARRSMVDNGSA
jgi:predicted nucleotidyltransferase